MFRWAVICLIISLIAGGLGLTNISVFAKRLSMIFFALFFLAGGALATTTPFFAVGVGDQKRTNPSICLPEEFRAQGVHAQVKSYMISVQRNHVRLGLLVPTDPKAKVPPRV